MKKDRSCTRVTSGSRRLSKVFEKSGRAVPVFNDKHLSTTWPRCLEMVEDARRLQFPFLAGSSLPVTWRLPPVDMPYGVPLRESVCVAYGGVDSYDFHGLETAQCMSERRQGGEVGIRQVQAIRGEAMWELLAGDDRDLTRRLLVAALNRSHNLPVDSGYPTAAVHASSGPGRPFPTPWRISSNTETVSERRCFWPRSGISTMPACAAITARSYHARCICPCRVTARPRPISSILWRTISRRWSLENRAPYPVERTLLTSGMVIGGVESLYRGQQPVETPEMEVRYTAPRESLYRRS